jgi:hypothetical protein
MQETVLSNTLEKIISYYYSNILWKYLIQQKVQGGFIKSGALSSLLRKVEYRLR